MSAEVVLVRVDLDQAAYGRHPRHRPPALDLKYVQAGIEALTGRTVPLIDYWVATSRPAADARPRVAVVKGASWCLDEAVACASALRAAGAITIGVGQQVAHVARAGHPGWREAFHIPFPGEPEEALPPLVAALLAGADVGEIARRHWLMLSEGRRYEVIRPDALPPPRFTADELAAHPFPFPLRGRFGRRWGYVLSAWGCPRGCRHCTAIVRKSVGPSLRRRSPSRVADEVQALLERGAQAIAFEDDSLLVDRRHFLELCAELERRRLRFPWMANARPDELDAARVAAAAGAGAVLLKVGVDAAAPRLIEAIGKARDGHAWVAAAEQGFERLNRAGIGSVALFMVGLPDETEAEVEASIALALRLAPDYVQVQQFCAYPDIPMWNDLPPAQRATAPIYHYGAPRSSASRIAPGRLPLLQSRFYRQFYLRPQFVASHLRRTWRAYADPATLRQGIGALSYLAGAAFRQPRCGAPDAGAAAPGAAGPPRGPAPPGRSSGAPAP